MFILASRRPEGLRHTLTVGHPVHRRGCRSSYLFLVGKKSACHAGTPRLLSPPRFAHARL